MLTTKIRELDGYNEVNDNENIFESHNFSIVQENNMSREEINNIFFFFFFFKEICESCISYGGFEHFYDFLTSELRLNELL